MISKKTKIQIVAFVLIALTAVIYAGGKYAGLDRLFGSRGYVVTVQLADSGGIFTNAEVTYRGVAIGRVSALRVNDKGVEVDLDIDSSSAEIPADTQAVVANRSAIGEQYVDLRPNTNAAPYLEAGSVIPIERTAIPPAAENVLVNLDNLVRSIPLDSLGTVVDELHVAVGDVGPDLQRLLDSANSLTTAATEHLPQTTGLISDGRIVLTRQQADSDKLIAFSSGLQRISAQLRDSDPALRQVINSAPAVGDHVVDILRTSGTDLGVVIANLLTTMQVTTSREDAIRTLLIALPVVSAFTPSTAPDATGHLGLMLNFFDPWPCLKGYEGTHQRAANEIEPAPANRAAYCAEPPGSPIGVRGSQNAPFPGMPEQAAGDAAAPAPAAADPRSQLPGALELTGGGLGLTGFGQLLGLPG
jgi:phospholipid/cholesterol/gamma-HCH transport system substrate-binding protein